MCPSSSRIRSSLGTPKIGRPSIKSVIAVLIIVLPTLGVYSISYSFWVLSRQADFDNALTRGTADWANHVAVENATYQRDLGRSDSTSSYLGLKGFTINDAGGGIEDTLTTQPVRPPDSPFPRSTGGNFKYGPVEVKTVVDLAYVVLIVGAQNRTNVDVNVSVSNPARVPVNIGHFLGNGIFPQFINFSDGNLTISPVVLFQNQTLSIDVVPETDGMLFSTDSYFWMNVYEAPIPPPPEPNFPPKPTAKSLNLGDQIEFGSSSFSSFFRTGSWLPLVIGTLSLGTPAGLVWSSLSKSFNEKTTEFGNSEWNYVKVTMISKDFDVYLKKGYELVTSSPDPRTGFYLLRSRKQT